MKAHIQKKKDELDKTPSRWNPAGANGSALRPAASARPGPNPVPAAPPAPTAPPEIFNNFSDPAGLWQATRRHLSLHAHLLETVLGECAHISAINPESREITLTLPASQRNFTNDRAKSKLEEALRSVTAHPFRLLLEFTEIEPDPARKNIGITRAGLPGAPPPAAAQRIPPELMTAIRDQPLIRELTARFDAVITLVEILPAAGETEP